MNEDQKKAIDTLMPTLVEVLQSSVFEVYLSSNGYLSNNECEVVNSSGPTNGHKVIKIFSIIKWKERSWDLVMKYLRDHKYPWLATDLLIEAKMETAEADSQLQSTSTPARVQYGSAAAASYNAASNQSPNPSGGQTTSAKPQLRVPPVTKLVKSTSDVSINPDATVNLALKDKIRMFEGKSLMYGSNAEMNVSPSAVQHPPTDPHRNIPKPTGTAAKVSSRSGNGGFLPNLQANGEEFVSAPTDANKIVKSTPTKECDDDIEKIIAKLREKSLLQSFAQLLPEIISQIQIYSTSTKFQLECIRLIQTFLPQKLSELTAELKANLVETMLTCLQSNFNDESIVHSCIPTLAELEIFSDPIVKYTKTVEILLKIISNPEMTTNTKGWVMWLLCKIITDSDENGQNLVGQIGGVEQICEVIRQQLDNPTYDRILEFSWLCLQNLCWNSLENQKKFLSAGGVDLFHLCYEKFGDKVEMVNWMMRMMANLSWFPSLRPQLVSKRNFEVFWKILLKFNDNVAISWRCVDTFANFLSDSTLIWPLASPTVEEAKNLLIETINKWQLDAKTNLNISTFKPRLDQLKLHKFSLADLLVIWTIANCTTADASKYCRMLSEEGGVEILTTEVIRHSNSSLDAVVLAKMAIENVNKWAKSAIQH